MWGMGHDTPYLVNRTNGGQQQQRPTVLRQQLPQLAQKPPPLSGSKPQALQQKISQGRQQARKTRQIASRQPPSESVIVYICDICCRPVAAFIW
ncbi:unnamed protein product [Rotaria sp. Silwood2]|nr:unnamed protein product [Rotaria sp. Silwood2]CAF4471590.1 unnamed protein product [Rotaria sp. Silwood2]